MTSRRLPPLSIELPLISGPCVYFLLRAGEVIYVGQTMRLSFRLNGHEPKGFDAVRYLPLPVEQLDVAEQAFIAFYEPKLNRTTVEVGPAHVRFLAAQDLKDARRLRAVQRRIRFDAQAVVDRALTTIGTTSARSDRSKEG